MTVSNIGDIDQDGYEGTVHTVHTSCSTSSVYSTVHTSCSTSTEYSTVHTSCSTSTVYSTVHTSCSTITVYSVCCTRLRTVQGVYCVYTYIASNIYSTYSIYNTYHILCTVQYILLIMLGIYTVTVVSNYCISASICVYCTFSHVAGCYLHMYWHYNVLYYCHVIVMWYCCHMLVV